jgi:hypothetical protein
MKKLKIGIKSENEHERKRRKERTKESRNENQTLRRSNIIHDLNRKDNDAVNKNETLFCVHVPSLRNTSNNIVTQEHKHRDLINV